MSRYNISFLGAGRVASALCMQLYQSGNSIGVIVSPTPQRGTLLADSCNASWSGNPEFPASADVIIVAVPDRILAEALGRIKCSDDTLVVHTAGSIGIEVFPESIKRKGVFYPLQTFSQNRKVSFSGLPFFIETPDERSSEIMRDLARSTGGKAFFVDSERRRNLHLAAVFTNNFVNHMLTAGSEIARKAGFPFHALAPLLQETVAKAVENGPENSQTGPAIRNDANVIEKHLELLDDSPELQDIYRVVSRSIINHYKNHNRG